MGLSYSGNSGSHVRMSSSSEKVGAAGAAATFLQPCEPCPAGALAGGVWIPGIEREAILDARACDDYKKTHFFKFHGGHNCGICTQACPVGRKVLRPKGSD